MRNNFCIRWESNPASAWGVLPLSYLFMAFSTSSLALAAFSYSARSHFRRWSSGLEPPARSSPALLPFSFSAIVCLIPRTTMIQGGSFYICKSEIKAGVRTRSYLRIFFVKKKFSWLWNWDTRKMFSFFLMLERKAKHEIDHSYAFKCGSFYNCKMLFLVSS